MGIIIAYGIILCVYAVCPFLVQIAGFAINAFVPDPIPFLDEFIMILCMFTKLGKIIDFIDNVEIFISEHRVLVGIIGIIGIIVIALVIGIVIYFNR